MNDRSYRPPDFVIQDLKIDAKFIIVDLQHNFLDIQGLCP